MKEVEGDEQKATLGVSAMMLESNLNLKFDQICVKGYFCYCFIVISFDGVIL